MNEYTVRRQYECQYGVPHVWDFEGRVCQKITSHLAGGLINFLLVPNAFLVVLVDMNPVVLNLRYNKKHNLTNPLQSIPFAEVPPQM